jgi:hypothetical protein
MTIPGSLFVIAVGAILRYAVDASISGVDIQTVGLILLLVGIVGLIFGVYWAFVRKDPRAAGVEPPPPPRY